MRLALAALLALLVPGQALAAGAGPSGMAWDSTHPAPWSGAPPVFLSLEQVLPFRLAEWGPGIDATTNRPDWEAQIQLRQTGLFGDQRSAQDFEIPPDSGIEIRGLDCDGAGLSGRACNVRLGLAAGAQEGIYETEVRDRISGQSQRVRVAFFLPRWEYESVPAPSFRITSPPTNPAFQRRIFTLRNVGNGFGDAFPEISIPSGSLAFAVDGIFCEGPGRSSRPDPGASCYIAISYIALHDTDLQSATLQAAYDRGGRLETALLAMTGQATGMVGCADCHIWQQRAERRRTGQPFYPFVGSDGQIRWTGNALVLDPCSPGSANPNPAACPPGSTGGPLPPDPSEIPIGGNPTDIDWLTFIANKQYAPATSLAVVGTPNLGVNAGGAAAGTQIRSAWNRLTLTNSGNIDIQLDGSAGITVSSDSPQRVETDRHTCPGARLRPGESCSIDVRFVHAGNGTVARTFVVAGLPQGVPAPPARLLTGVATGYLSLRLTGEPSASLSFNANGAIIGTQVNSPPIVLRLQNISNTSVTVGDVEPTGTGPTPILNSTCRNATLAPNASCNVLVSFTHTANGTLSRTFAVQGTPTQATDSGPLTVSSIASGFVTAPPPPPPPPPEPPAGGGPGQ
jgi:hypothetical protein